jgi:hypothetical protein
MSVHPEIHSMAECSRALPCKGRPLAFLLTSFALTLSLPTDAGAVEIPRVSVPVPRVNIPTPHVHVPTPHINTPRINMHTNTAQAHTPHIKASAATANNSSGTKSAGTSTSTASPNATSTSANSATSKSSTPSGNTASAKPTVTLTSPPPVQKTTTAATTPAKPPSLCAATLGCASAPPPPPSPQNQTTVTIMTTNNTCVVVPSSSPNPGSGNFNGGNFSSGNILAQLNQVALVVDEAGSPGPGQFADFALNSPVVGQYGPNDLLADGSTPNYLKGGVSQNENNSGSSNATPNATSQNQTQLNGDANINGGPNTGWNDTTTVGVPIGTTAYGNTTMVIQGSPINFSFWGLDPTQDSVGTVNSTQAPSPNRDGSIPLWAPSYNYQYNSQIGQFVITQVNLSNGVSYSTNVAVPFNLSVPAPALPSVAPPPSTIPSGGF